VEAMAPSSFRLGITTERSLMGSCLGGSVILFTGGSCLGLPPRPKGSENRYPHEVATLASLCIFRLSPGKWCPGI
jgi:hypothetical protein